MDAERIGVLEAQFAAHAKADDTGFERINSDTTKIMVTLEKMSTKLDSVVERIHTRIEETTASVRHALNNEAQISRAGVKSAMDFAQEAHDRVSTQALETEKQVNGLHIKFLAGLLATGVAIIGWFADHFFGKAH